MIDLSAVVGNRCMVWAATSQAASDRFLHRHGIDAELVVTGRELAGDRERLRGLAETHGIEVLLIHSVDWERQTAPQLYELAATLAGVRRIFLVDERTQRVSPWTRRATARAACRLPAELFDGVYRATEEVLRFRVRGYAKRPTRKRAKPSLKGADVLAISLYGAESQVGGAVTHLSGILGAFQKAGLRVGLVTDADPPEQLASAIDEYELTSPLSRGSRGLTDLRLLAENRAVRHAALKLAERAQPRFIYQRHRALLVGGRDVSHRLKVPLILEWNASEAWMRNWSRTQGAMRLPIDRLVGGLAVEMEQSVVADAALVVAVSGLAAKMARSAGADPARLMVVPNGVDLAAIDMAVGSMAPRDAPGRVVVGWVGSFGAWHGAEVLIRALAKLPEHVSAVMIGDGPERAKCMALAESHSLNGRLDCPGQLPHSDALARLASCDILTSPTVPFVDQPFFGSPTKLFEYMGIGRPIVASRLEQIAEVLEDGVTARLVAPGDPDDLARAIAEVVASPDRGRGLGIAARRKASSAHTWDHRAQAILRRLPA